MTSENQVDDSEKQKKLNCDCEEYACHCRKQCFCKMTDKLFDGDNIEKRERGKDDLDPRGSFADHQFKCSCSFDGVGGFGLVN